MAREKFQTLTEQMFYILLSLQEELCGVESLTDGRVTVGPGTLYHLLDEFLTAGMIEETKAEGRRRSYRITSAGQSALEAEYRRLRVLVTDYEACIHEGGSAE